MKKEREKAQKHQFKWKNSFFLEGDLAAPQTFSRCGVPLPTLHRPHQASWIRPYRHISSQIYATGYTASSYLNQPPRPTQPGHLIRG